MKPVKLLNAEQAKKMAENYSKDVLSFPKKTKYLFKVLDKILKASNSGQRSIKYEPWHFIFCNDKYTEAVFSYLDNKLRELGFKTEIIRRYRKISYEQTIYYDSGMNIWW